MGYDHPMAKIAREEHGEDAGIRLMPDEEVHGFDVWTKAGEDGQASLFGDGALQQGKALEGLGQKYSEMYMPSGGITRFRKGIAALHSTPVDGDLSLNIRRVMDGIAALVQIHFRKLPKPQQELLFDLRASPRFVVGKGELRKMAGIRSKQFDRVEEALKTLSDMKIKWNIMGEEAQVEWEMTSRYLSSYGVGLGRFAGQVCFSMDPDVMRMVLEPQLWVKLELDVMRQLGTETSYALYQQAWRYVGTKSGRTADFVTATWIELLMGRCRYVVTDEAGNKRVVDYSEWKKRHLLPAMEKVNSIAALTHRIELIEIRSGLKVTRLQFKFVPKREVQAEFDMPVAWPEPVIASLKSLGFTEVEIAEMGQGFNLDQVIESISRFGKTEARKKQKGERIMTPTAFFQGILHNVDSEREFGEKEMVEIERKAKSDEAERRNKEAKEKAEFDFSNFQVKRLMDNLSEWEEERRVDMLKAFEASPAFGSAKLLVAKGWDKAGKGAWIVLKSWLLRERPDDYFELLPNPEDREMSDWLVWRLGQA